VDRRGDVSVVDPRLSAEFGDVDNMALAPDGRFVAVEVQRDRDVPGEGLPSQIWIYDLERRLPQRLTFQGERNASRAGCRTAGPWRTCRIRVGVPPRSGRSRTTEPGATSCSSRRTERSRRSKWPGSRGYRSS
jgi:hypothetical protein